MATVTSVGDRLHAINQTLTTVTPFRYFSPTLVDNSADHPALYFRIGNAVVRNDTAQTRLRVTRTYTLVVLVGDVSKAVNNVTMQEIAEPIIDDIEAAYRVRPRLELDYAPLDGVLECEMAGGSGLTVAGSIAQLTFNLSITTLRVLNLGGA